MTDTFTAEYDPADFTVDQVTAYLATASAEDTAAVKAAEGDGKARKGVLDYQAPVDAPRDADEDGYTRVPVDNAYQPGEPVDLEPFLEAAPQE